VARVEIRVYTFAELNDQDAAGRMRDLLEEVELAEQVGLDVFGIGEHHRPDFVVSAPAVVLAAAAARTERIRLTSAVTVLSSDDPVRVFQEFAEVDLISNGRAEIMAGRGSFIESFPLFGYDLDDYDALFEEKLGLLLALRDSVRVTWSGKHRAPIEDLGIYPRPVQDPLPVWLAVGGTPTSALRAGTLGLPMALAIIGGQPERFKPFAELFRRSAEEAGHPGLPLSINSHAYVADTSQRAADEFFPGYATMMNRIGRERGWAPMERPSFDALRTLRGALVVGSADEVVEKILYQHQLFGHQRFMAQMSVGTMPHAQVMRSIELFGTEVAPVVRKELAGSTQNVPV
jgi:probable LLM family oxidoreductase